MKQQIKAGDIYFFKKETDDFHTNNKCYIITNVHLDIGFAAITCDDSNYTYMIPFLTLKSHFLRITPSPHDLIEMLFDTIK